MTLYLRSAYQANSEVQKSGVSTNQKQTAIGLLFKDSISLIKHSWALWTLQNKHNHKIWTEVTNTSSSSDANPEGGITLCGFVFLFFKLGVTCLKWQNYTAQHQRWKKMLKKDLYVLLWRNMSVWDVNIKAMTWKTKEHTGGRGWRGCSKPDEKTSSLKRNKSISLSPNIREVLRL